MTRMDLTGQRFGKLSVTGEAPPTRSPAGKSIRRWVCKCDCGRETIVAQSALTGKNGTRSCGCSRGDASAVDMTGQRFGRLTVIKRVPLERPLSNGQRSGWLCKCDCGRETVVQRKELLSGDTQSCGCLLRDTARKKVAVDNVLGRYDGTVTSAIRPDRGPNQNNSCGVKGVYWNASEQCYIAKIGVRGQSVYRGRFKRLEDAAEARRRAEAEYYKPILDTYESEGDNDGQSNS